MTSLVVIFTGMADGFHILTAITLPAWSAAVGDGVPGPLPPELERLYNNPYVAGFVRSDQIRRQIVACRCEIAGKDVDLAHDLFHGISVRAFAASVVESVDLNSIVERSEMLRKATREKMWPALCRVLLLVRASYLFRRYEPHISYLASYSVERHGSDALWRLCGAAPVVEPCASCFSATSIGFVSIGSGLATDRCVACAISLVRDRLVDVPYGKIEQLSTAVAAAGENTDAMLNALNAFFL